MLAPGSLGHVVLPSDKCDLLLLPSATHWVPASEHPPTCFLYRESRELMGPLAPWALLGEEETQVWLAYLEHRGLPDSRSALINLSFLPSPDCNIYS